MEYEAELVDLVKGVGCMIRKRDFPGEVARAPMPGVERARK
jgi:hypothetical protein